MKLLDKLEPVHYDVIQGRFKIIRTHAIEGTSVVCNENIVVDNARKIIRDLVFGDTPIITKLVLGDMGYGAGSPWDEPEPANGTELKLVNQLAFVPVTSKAKIVDEETGRNGIVYTFLMPVDKYNGLSGTLKIVELGLATDTDELFTKKNRPMLSKDFETQLEISYTLLF